MVNQSPDSSSSGPNKDETERLKKEDPSRNNGSAGKGAGAEGVTSVVLTAAHTLAPYPKLSDLPPVGQSIWPLLWKRDPASPARKTFYVVLSTLSFCFMLQPTLLLIPFPWWDVSWDKTNHIIDITDLLEVTLGLSTEINRTNLWITFGFVIALIAADIILGQLQSIAKQGSEKNIQSDTFPWPTAWKTENYICYHEMFSEPTRYGRLLRRPGNTLSNFGYVFACLSVLSSCFLTDKPNPYWYSDVQYGTAIFVLTIMSAIWHGSNAPWSHYPDLASMFSSISYLLVRYSCQGVVLILFKYLNIDFESAQRVATTICFLAYTAVLLGLGTFYYIQFTKGWLHGGSPDSVRSRILGISNVFACGHDDIYVSTICAFTSLPLLFLMGPTSMQLWLYGTCGSKFAGNLAFRTLAVGWTYRTWERFILDGYPVMNYFLALPAGIVKTVGCAIVSPTAQHHMWTAATLLTGYIHSRSLEGLEPRAI